MSAVEVERVPPEHHHDHRDVTGGWLRPAVFGMMDGLVSNTALIAGVGGGGVEGRALVLTGLAGLAAGAFSMATGEYTSVAAQTELTRAEIEIEKAEIQRVPEAEEAELAAIYRSRGVDEETSRAVARQLSADPEQAWRVHAREELGVDPDDLPSPWVATGSSFVAFSFGALVPLLPYLLGASSLLLAVVLAGIALFVAGAVVSRFTNRSALYSGTRQLVLGGLAAGVTHLVGQAVGATG
ncbi:MAG: VIT1/CCC1 transporter family protein [Actinobacteria bacterium]|nr:VIT1/CCC1 transporter family protein [Actinomycetota bacterium]MCA1721311.1 VIT1/CCC1 transporter family protein [Actinomycetota bacterium]